MAGSDFIRPRIFTQTSAVVRRSASVTLGPVDCDRFRRITGRVFADQAGTLTIEQSDDNLTWDTTFSNATVASTSFAYDQVVYLRFVRLRWANGSAITDTTVFRASGYANIV